MCALAMMTVYKTIKENLVYINNTEHFVPFNLLPESPATWESVSNELLSLQGM